MHRPLSAVSAVLLGILLLSDGCRHDSDSKRPAPAPAAPEPEKPLEVVELPEPEFHWGVSVRRAPEAFTEAADLGCTSARFDMTWSVVEPILTTPSLVLADVTDSMIDHYAYTDPSKNWVPFDAMMAECAEKGIRPLVILGNGFSGEMPQYRKLNGQMARFGPDAGTDHYLACLYLFTSACVKRYGKQVRHWQLENELNAAGYAIIWGWRAGLAWTDWRFLTDVLTTLKNAVRWHDDTAVIAVNFHTSMPEWPVHLQLWKDHMDAVGLDSYPNYLTGWPNLGDAVGSMVWTAKRIAPGKKYLVLESGYPTAPSYQGFSEDGQVEFMNRAISSSRANGAHGFFWFNLKTPELPNVAGNHFPFSLIGVVEGYWGLFKSDGTPKRAHAVYKALIGQ